MLSAGEIVKSREKPLPELPSLGVKDFEPNGSQEQLHQIEHSLCEIENAISYKRVKSLNSLSQAVWREELNLAEITHQTGSYWSYMGHKIGQQLYIYPEEALYLLETGALEVIYNGVSISVQRAYFVLIESKSNMSLEKYRVYSLLSSHGFKVLRHSPQNTVTKYEKKIEIHKLGLKLKNYSNIVNAGKRQAEDQFLKPNKKPKVSTKVTPPLGCNIGDDKAAFLKRLQVIQSYTDSTEATLTFDYDIYSDMLDKHSFKKSSLQLPTYRVIVHRGEDSMPDMNELCKLSNKYEDEVPVIHAVVFYDYIAFYRIDSVILPDLNE